MAPLVFAIQLKQTPDSNISQFEPEYNSKFYEFPTAYIQRNTIDVSDPIVANTCGSEEWSYTNYTEIHIILGEIQCFKLGESILTFHMKEVATSKNITTTVKIIVKAS